MNASLERSAPLGLACFYILGFWVACLFLGSLVGFLVYLVYFLLRGFQQCLYLCDFL